MVEGRDSEHDVLRDRGEHRESPKQVRGRYQGAGNGGDNRDIFKGLAKLQGSVRLSGSIMTDVLV